MQISRRSLFAGSAAAVGVTALAACGGSSNSGSGGGDDAAIILANGTEPENKLLTTNTTEVGGGRVLTSVFSGLVYYTEQGEVENDLAESIESEDNITWTIKIKADQKYSDGTVIKAEDFVRAWNYGALTTNAQSSQDFFEPIEGFDEVGAEKPTAEELKGLTVVDDTTFTVKLTSAQSDFPNRLGYTAYMPWPASALDDLEAFGEKPVSSGPYKVDAWEHDKEIRLVVNEHYDGPRKAKNGGITFKIYADPDTLYNDLTSDNGSVDVVDQIPNSALSTFENDLGERAVNQDGAVFQAFTFAAGDKNFEGEAGKLRKQAISMAIDRKAICDSLFFGTRSPATDFIAPVIDGGGATDIPGNEVLQFNAAKAKELWDQAEGMQKFEGDFTLAYNADGPHKDWVEAVCNSIKQTLGITATPTPYPEFGKFREVVGNREIKGAFRTGWQADYPSMFNFLGPLYSSAAADGKGSNDSDFKNPEFDTLLKDGLAAPDADAAIEKFKAAEAVLMENLPSVPLWYQNTIGGYSSAVSDVKYGWDTVPLYYEITKK